jgi:hypothetical protein
VSSVRINRLLFLLAVLIVGILLGSVVSEVLEQGQQLDQMTDDRSALATDVEVLRDQLIRLGETPDAGPPEPGERGDTGERGPAGRDGLDGRDGIDGVDGLPGAVGPAGPAGETGATGATGDPGPQGEPGPMGPQGPAGPQGEPGTTCPSGYALQPDTIHGEDVLICTRNTE